jgi:DNA-binding PadR family transcriptional regulator
MPTKKVKTEPTVKTYTLTEAQFKTLEEISDKLEILRRGLGELEGEENVSTIMFKVGSVYNNADWCEDEIRDIINSFDEDNCEDCDDNF